jgi:HK97 family phage prohead protease
MPRNLLSTDDFRAAARDGGAAPDATVFRFTDSASPIAIAAASRTATAVFSEESVDLANDLISVKGWDYANYLKNPVVPFGHDTTQPPIGRARNVRVRGKQLVGDIEFAGPDVYEFADTVFQLVKGRFLNAVSVGFKPLKWAFSNDKNRPGGINFLEQRLLEVSVVPVPCHPGALIEARSAGIDTRGLVSWAERILDSGKSGVMPRRQLETLRTQASDVAERQHYAARLKQSLRKPETPAERLAEAARIRSDIAARQVRLAEVAAIRRTLPTSLKPNSDDILRAWRAEQGIL